MTRISAIVEGHGEVAALPVLLRRFPAWRAPGVHVEIPTPIRVSRDRFLQRDEDFRRYLALAASKCGQTGWVLLLLDADDDCPARLAPGLQRRAADVIPGIALSVVLANREFEAWFIGAATSLHGHRGLTVDPQETVDPESPRNAKGWLAARMASRRYGETTDQPAFAGQMDLQQAFDRCRSFRKLCTEWDRQLAR